MAIWAELKKVVNSDFSKPLNVSINELLSKSMVKSVQRGVITLSVDTSSNKATISSVNTSKAVVIYTGDTYSYAGSSPGAYREHYYLELTNSTTVTAKCATNINDEVKIPYQVIEFA